MLRKVRWCDLLRTNVGMKRGLRETFVVSHLLALSKGVEVEIQGMELGSESMFCLFFLYCFLVFCFGGRFKVSNWYDDRLEFWITLSSKRVTCSNWLLFRHIRKSGQSGLRTWRRFMSIIIGQVVLMHVPLNHNHEGSGLKRISVFTCWSSEEVPPQFLRFWCRSVCSKRNTRVSCCSKSRGCEVICSSQT